MTSSSERIPIIGGTGALGAGLARRWAKAGVPVTIGSRDAERAAEAATRVREAIPGADVNGCRNEEAATQGEIVFLTVPFRAQSENLNNLREALRPGQLLVDCTVPLAADVLVCGDRKADKAQVARLIELIPGLRAVNAGALEMARIVEQLPPMLIAVNSRYKTHAGIRLTGLPEADHWA